MICQNCIESAEAQRIAMEPRQVKEGWALVAMRDPFLQVAGQPLPDIRIGDIVEVRLIAGAVPDAGWCHNSECENYERSD